VAPSRRRGQARRCSSTSRASRVWIVGIQDDLRAKRPDKVVAAPLPRQGYDPRSHPRHQGQQCFPAEIFCAGMRRQGHLDPSSGRR
jgi:hypothetical protein